MTETCQPLILYSDSTHHTRVMSVWRQRHNQPRHLSLFRAAHLHFWFCVVSSSFCWGCSAATTYVFVSSRTPCTRLTHRHAQKQHVLQPAQECQTAVYDRPSPTKPITSALPLSHTHCTHSCTNQTWPKTLTHSLTKRHSFVHACPHMQTHARRGIKTTYPNKGT